MFQLRNIVDPETREIVKNPDRVTRPMVRRPGASQWEEITWDDAVAEIARKVKEAGIPTASLMLTSYDANQYVMAALRAGARGYVLKTATMDTLSRAIRIAARGGFYLDSDVASAVEEGEDFVPEPVSVREREVLLLAARGLSGKEIASQLFISERTVQTHLASIYDKLGAKNKTEAMLLSLKYGIVTMEELLD